MNTRAKHPTHWPLIGSLMLAACALAGCWEEVHYTPPPGGEARKSRPSEAVPPPAAAYETADEFADDLATSLDETQPATAPPPSESAAAAADVEPLRYVEPAPITPEVAEAIEAPPPVDAAPPEPAAPVESADRSTPTPPPAAGPAGNTRRVAWLLGTKLSLAALAHDRGADPAEVEKWFGQSQSLAKLLGTTVDALPPRPAAGIASNQGVDHVFAQGQRIGGELATRFGDDEAALFELAVKSNVLIAVYQPHAPIAIALLESIEEAGQRAGLPADVFAPLAKAVADGEGESGIRIAVYEMNRGVDEYLSRAPERQP